jgi:CO/xanthine dehydrogenase FAD-binding subunit
VDLSTVTGLVPATTTAWRDGDAWLGGGTWLFSQPQPEVSRLLDLHAFGWPPLRERHDGLVIAATCTFAQLAAWQPTYIGRDSAALLARQCCDALLGSFKVRNVATIGGNICLSLPAGPMISLAELVTGDGRNVLAPGELLIEVTLPSVALTARTAFRQLSLSPVGRSAVLVIACLDAGGATVVSVTAATPRPVCLRFLAPPTPTEALTALGSAVPGYLDDVHGSANWRAAMTHRLVTEALAELAR